MKKNRYETVGLSFIYASIGMFVLGALMFTGVFPYALFQNAPASVVHILNFIFQFTFFGWFPALFIGICVMIISPLGKK